MQQMAVEMGVLADRDSDLLLVRLDRRERRNAIDPEMATSLLAAFETFDRDKSLKVAVLTGDEMTFCSGADIEAMRSGARWDTGPHGTGSMGPTRLQLTKPVIAAVEGHAIGGGFELALWCDLRIATESSVFSLGSRRWGIPCLDGGTFRLPRLIGHSRAIEIILTGRQVPAVEALAIGLIHKMVEPGKALDAALEMARMLASLPQDALRNDRHCTIEQWSLSQEDAARNEACHGTKLLVGSRALIQSRLGEISK